MKLEHDNLKPHSIYTSGIRQRKVDQCTIQQLHEKIINLIQIVQSIVKLYYQPSL